MYRPSVKYSIVEAAVAVGEKIDVGNASACFRSVMVSAFVCRSADPGFESLLGQGQV